MDGWMHNHNCGRGVSTCPSEDLSRRLSRSNNMEMSTTAEPHFYAKPLMHPLVASHRSKGAPHAQIHLPLLSVPTGSLSQSPLVHQVILKSRGLGEAHPAHRDTLNPLADSAPCPVPESQPSPKLLPQSAGPSTPRTPSLSLQWPLHLCLPPAFLEEDGTCAEELPLSTATGLLSG